MALIVRFHALNPTMKARDDLPIPHFDDFLTAADVARGDESVSGVSLLQSCATCGKEEMVGQIQTQMLR